MEINRVATNSAINSYTASKTKAEGDFAAQLSKATANPAAGDDARLKSVCREMEAVFLNLMLSRMRATVPKSDLLPDRSKEEIMQSMLDSELTKNMAHAGGAGLADMLYRQLTLPGTATNAKSQAPK
ncbi:MAG: flagellar biosynthesis protein FlgJ [Veillonellaceae bacterium]|jgi:flagellar protein FlgJ|nr:flagellar biosynthesis protein FlgJ [Veillonellaceae bacterium]